MTRLRVCLLWHMHQPMYRDPRSGEYILPWVRLHATRSYLDLTNVIAGADVPSVVNVVPSLMLQLEDYASGKARDRFLDLTQRPADALTGPEREAVLRSFFMVNWERNVKPLPRYWELLHRRGTDLRALDLSRVARLFSPSEMRDVQGLFNLAWMGFSANEGEEVVRSLKQKGRDFTESEKAALLEVQRGIVGRILPAFAALGKAGKAELTVTPYYHPILPLVLDTDSARRAMPDVSLPPRFSWPEDAREQVKRALAHAERALGMRPAGMWPAEGSVSPEALATLSAEGVRWCASDEGVMLRSRPKRARDPHLHRAFRVKVPGGGEMGMVFRDRGLSDLIGFTYAKVPAKEAVDDLFKHLTTIAKGARKGEVPLVTIALDGENCWETYPESGREFLRLLYARLSAREGDIEAVTPGKLFAAEQPAEVIEEVHSGSWISSNFHIWIGHPEDNAAWARLGEARAAVAEAERSGEDPAKVQRAKELLYVAEGSDWFWWYGDDFTTESAAEFDALFRAYVREAWIALGKEPPDSLDRPIKQEPSRDEVVVKPHGMVSPPLDGKELSYFDWVGAGTFRPAGGRGAMHQGPGPFAEMRFGFDAHNLYLRLDPADEGAKAEVVAVRVEAGTHSLEVHIPLVKGILVMRLVRSDGSQAEIGRAAFDEILEASIPFEVLGLAPGAKFGLQICAMNGSVEVDRLPSNPIELAVPDADWEQRNWMV